MNDANNWKGSDIEYIISGERVALYETTNNGNEKIKARMEILNGLMNQMTVDDADNDAVNENSETGGNGLAGKMYV